MQVIPWAGCPKKLRNSSKIIDCASPEYQESEQKRKDVENHNKHAKEWNDLLKKDMDSWSNRHDNWQNDVPEGDSTPFHDNKKYDVDYSRFKDVPDVEEAKPVIEERNWYYDNSGNRVKKTSFTVADPLSTENATELKKGFLSDAKKPLYSEGSEQRAPVSDEKFFQKFREQFSAIGEGCRIAPSGDSATSNSLKVTAPKLQAPEFTLTEAKEGESFQLVISVPGLSSMKGVDLDVCEHDASIVFPASSNLRPLKVELPKAVNTSATRAKFSKKMQNINVTLPLLTVH